MNEIKIKELIRYGESATLEFKEAGGNSLPSSLFDTICAFLNTEGGIILLGVKDNGEVSGINPDCVARLKTDLANLANNPQKLEPVFIIGANDYAVEFKNPNHPNGKGPINPNSFVPRPKNPVISKFMIQLGRAEELGSGITNVTKYLPFYTKGAKAVFIEDSMFTTVIPLVTIVKETPGKTPGKILSLLRENPNLTIPELAGKIGKSESAVERAVRKLCKSKHLERIGPDKGGHWKVIEK